MDLRMQFVTDWQTGCYTMSELCADYRISRKTGYKWTTRYELTGARGLHDQSRRPHGSPRATATGLVETLMALRRRHPRWGAKKLLAVAVRREPALPWPSRSTVCHLLRAHGLVVPRRRRAAPAAAPSPLAPITAANDVWTTDFKGKFRTRDGRYCYPLTLRDAFSRFVLRCDALLQPTHDATRRRFERAFAEYGLPTRIRSDNGSPFASPGLARVSRLSLWWMRLGIVPERIALGHPEQNGSHEQFHSVLKAETARPPAAHAAAQQRRFARFCVEYNQDRPHEALGQHPPATRYQASRRPLPSRLPPIDYPGHMEVRRVNSTGCISWRAAAVFVATALQGQDIALEEVDDGIWTIRFGTVALGRFDERRRIIHPIATLTEGRSAASPPRA
jgi:transposase InsO family protein